MHSVNRSITNLIPKLVNGVSKLLGGSKAASAPTASSVPSPSSLFGGGIMGFVLQRVVGQVLSLVTSSLKQDAADISEIMRSAEASIRCNKNTASLLGGPIVRFGPITQQFSTTMSLNGQSEKQISLRVLLASAHSDGTVDIAASTCRESNSIRIDRMAVCTPGGKVEVRDVPRITRIDVDGR